MTDHPTAGRIEGRAHLLPVRVYYEDTDFTGVVYHGAYVKFFERGRSDFLRLLGVGHAGLLEQDAMAFALSKLNLSFLKPARIDDALVVRTVWIGTRGPRLMARQSIERDGEVLCAAEVEAVCIRLDGRPRRPSQAMIAAVTPYLDASEA